MSFCDELKIRRHYSKPGVKGGRVGSELKTLDKILFFVIRNGFFSKMFSSGGGGCRLVVKRVGVGRGGTGIRGGRILSWTENIKISQAHAFQPVEFVIDPGIVFGRKFLNRIGTGGFRVHVFGFRQFRVITIDST